MGAGIAQLACLGRFETYLHDPAPPRSSVAPTDCARRSPEGAERGRWSAEAAEAAAARLREAPRWRTSRTASW